LPSVTPIKQISQSSPNAINGISMNQTVKIIQQVENELGPSVVTEKISTGLSLSALRRELAAARPKDKDTSMRLIVERALGLTRSTGAAIALSQGEEMVCRATAGSDVPGLGTRLQVRSGFSGECVRAGRLLRCDDSEADARVDRQSCRRLGVRSMVAVPIHSGDRIVGLLEIFSSHPNNYSRRDEVMLRELAEITKIALCRTAPPPAARNDLQWPPAPGISATGRVTNGEVQSSHSRLAEPGVIVQPRLLEKLSAGCSKGNLALVLSVAILTAVLWSFGPWVRPHGVASNPPKTTVNRSQSRALGPASNTFKTAVSMRPYADDLATVREMAEQGDPAAQFALGSRYAIGEEVRQDDSEAARWFSNAAKQGHTEAQAILGMYYMLGKGVPQDADKAYFWSILAQAGGDQGSKYRVKVLSSRMSPNRIRAAQEQADAWFRQRQARAAKPGTG
jgi:hypothetical protein